MMVCMTILPESQLNVPTGDEEVNEVIAEIRYKTGRNWQVVDRSYEKKRWFHPNEHCSKFSLYVEVGGMLPFQVISGVNTAQDIKSYLTGFLAGLDSRNKELLG